MLKSEQPIFDYIEQEYFDFKGNIVNIPYDNFPCSRCKTPSRLDNTKSQYEVYKCEDCNYSFTID